MAAEDDIWVIARALVRKHGSTAVAVAKREALKAQAKSLPAHADAWQAIADATARVLDDSDKDTN
ncbi:MAG TPA: hypothetical protein VGD08_19720 [Stellaceae bacterium]|jgi:hypothetical protein